MSRVSVRESAVTLQFAVLACAEGCEENGSSNSYIYCRGAPLLSKSSALRLYSVRCLALRASSSLKTFLALGSNLNTLQNRRPNAKRLAWLVYSYQRYRSPKGAPGKREDIRQLPFVGSILHLFSCCASLQLSPPASLIPRSILRQNTATENVRQPCQPTCSACG